MPRPFLGNVAMIPAGARTPPQKLGTPDVVMERQYDFVVIGAPTWWLSIEVPIREFLESDTVAKVIEGKSFTRVVCCQRYWKHHNLKSVQRMPRNWRVQGALPRRRDSPDRPSGLPPRRPESSPVTSVIALSAAVTSGRSKSEDNPAVPV